MAAMSESTTSRCRLLPLLGAVTLLVLLACQGSAAQGEEDDGAFTTTDATTTDTTSESGISNNKRFGGRSNIIIGGAFGLTEQQGRERRRASRRLDGDAESDTYTLTDLVSGNRRRGKNSRRRGRKGGDQMDTEQLTNNIEILANANQDIQDRAAEEERSASGRRRTAAGYARRYFGGMGRDIVGFPNRARETIDNAVSDMLGGVNNMLRMIPYDEIESTAMRVATYLEELVESGMPTAVLDSLMSSREGGARETLEALVEFQGSPEKLEPILEDIAGNYRTFFRGAGRQVEGFLSLIMPRRQQQGAENPIISALERLPPISNPGSTSGGFAPSDLVGDDNAVQADPNGQGGQE